MLSNGRTKEEEEKEDQTQRSIDKE